MPGRAPCVPCTWFRVHAPLAQYAPYEHKKFCVEAHGTLAELPSQTVSMH